MKILFTALFTLACSSLWAQQDTLAHNPSQRHHIYERYSVIPTVSIGFIDGYRNNYTLPSGFLKNNTSGFAPILVKLEYAVWRDVSLAATFSYDAIFYNFSQQYEGNNGPFVRYRTDNFRSLSGGISAFYHLRKFIPVHRLDPFVGVGLSLNNNRHSAYPQGDSTAIKLSHTLTPYFKVGARYYISDRFSLFGDLGYDKPCIFSLGFSCRFFSGKNPLK